MSVVVTKLIGGLGNQMFQYAAGLTLAKRLDVPLKLDIRGFADYQLRKFDLSQLCIGAEPATDRDLEIFEFRGVERKKSLFGALNLRLGRKLVRPYVEPHFQFDQNFESLAMGPVYLDGYWQSQRYFVAVEDQIRKEFSVRMLEGTSNDEIEQSIKACSASVSVHVRRGDYASNPVVTQFHGLCQVDYYQRAMGLIQKKFPSAQFFVFTDDPDWVSDHFPKEFAWQLVNVNPPEKGWMDMRLMSLCAHHIVANSSFSWWGAWLGHNVEKMVIAPDKWFASAPHDTRDLLPPGWIKV